MRRSVHLLTALALGSLAVSALPARAQDTSPSPKLRVVTTLGVLKSLAEEVGGERVEVEALADPRQDPHFVEPRPTLMRRAHEADVFIEVGLQLELWGQKVVDGSGNPRIQSGQPGRVIASKGISTLELPTTLSREWGDVHPYGNPHVWLDPLNAADMAANIADGFSAVDPAHADEYSERLEAFRRRIDERLFGAALVEEIGPSKLARLARQGRLDEYLASRGLSDKLGGWLAKAAPLKGDAIVSYHKTFIYLATRFGLEIVAEIEERPGIPPSARHRDAVLELMRERGVHTILQALFYDRTAADYLAEHAGAEVVEIAIDAGSEVGAPDYASMIDRILDGLLAAKAAH